METKTKTGFTVIRVVEIPIEYLHTGVIKALRGLASFTDTNKDINEKIYSGDVFETIKSDDLKLPSSSMLKLSYKERKQVAELAEECKDYELVRINKI